MGYGLFGTARRRRRRLLAWALAVLLGSTACGGDTDPARRTPATASPTLTASRTPSATPSPVALPWAGRTLLPRYRLVGYVGAPASSALGRLGIGDLDSRAREIERRANPCARGCEIMPGF